MTKTDPLRDATLHLLTAWYQNLPQTFAGNFEQDDPMNWRRVYAAWERKTLAKGRAEGKAEGKAEGMAEGQAEGQLEGMAKGKAEALLIVLGVRALHPTAKQREQILACRDIARLDQWLVAAHLISDVKDLFAIPAPTRRRNQRRAA